MLARFSRTAAVAKSAQRTNQLVAVPQRRFCDAVSLWIGPPYWTFLAYQLAIVFPIFVQEIFKPALVTHKIPLLHHLYERKNEMKMLRHLDSIVTEWTTDVDAAAFGDAISRTQLHI